MERSITIELKNLNHSWHVDEGAPSTIRGAFAHLFRPRQMRIVPALKNVTVTFNEGDVVAIFGRNGSGKTTLCRFLAGAYGANPGVNVKGRVLPVFRSQFNLYPELSVWDNLLILEALTFGPRDFAVESEVAREVLDFCGLEEYRDRPLRHLSAGMNERMVLSLITSRAPEIYIFDEVFFGADRGFRAKLGPRMAQRLREAKTTLVVSHDLEIVQEYCNRGLVLEAGQIVFDGDLQQALAFYKAIH